MGFIDKILRFFGLRRVRDPAGASSADAASDATSNSTRGAADGNRAPTGKPGDAFTTDLGALRIGWMVDYDIRTWRVTDHEIYRFNDGATADSWELTNGPERLYLERSLDDGEVEWSLSKVLPIENLDGVRDHILAHDDPPESVEHEGRAYRLDWSVGGSVRSIDPTSGRPGDERRLVEWELVDGTEERFLAIQQWSETEFTASQGEVVKPFLFTHILPGAPS